MIDKKSSLDVKSRLGREQARKLLNYFFNSNPNSVSFTKHALKQMKDRHLIAGDIMNVLRAGKIYGDPEFEQGTWRYRVETSKITVVFAFNTPDRIRIITAWRNK